MWLALAFLSAFLLGCYEVNKKMSLNVKSLKKEKFTNKNGSHSALNMFTEYSMTDPGDLAEYFGFTKP